MQSFSLKGYDLSDKNGSHLHDVRGSHSSGLAGNDAVKQGSAISCRPLLTLQEAGALLGVSDRVAMVAENAAFGHLRAIFQKAGIRTYRDLTQVDEDTLESATGSVAKSNGREEYAAKDGWFRINKASPHTGTRGVLRSAVVSCALLHLSHRRVWAPPVFFRPVAKAQHVKCGAAEGFSMYGDVAVFRSMSLCRVIRRSGVKRLDVTAKVDMFSGLDVEGTFELPVVMALVVREVE